MTRCDQYKRPAFFSAGADSDDMEVVECIRHFLNSSGKGDPVALRPPHSGDGMGSMRPSNNRYERMPPIRIAAATRKARVND